MLINLFIIVFILLVIHCVWQNNKINKNKTVFFIFQTRVRIPFSSERAYRMVFCHAQMRLFKQRTRIKFLLKCVLLLCFSFLILSLGGIFHNYSRTQETRTLKGNDKQFELWGFELSGSITNSIFQVEN